MNVATFFQQSYGGNYLVLGAVIGGLWMVGAAIRRSASRQRDRRDVRMRRLDLLAESLRDPNLDPAARAEVVRAIANERTDFGGWLWRQLHRPMLWKVLWFGCGWLTMLMCGAALIVNTTTGGHFISSWDVPAVVMLTVAGFGMVTLPLALRELLRRERAPASR